jgi:hypothetical protein
MIRNSIYWGIYNRKDRRLNLGFKYKGQVLKKTLSNQMFGVNPILDGFIDYMESFIYEHIEAVKQIKIFANPALDKNENRLN